MTAVELIRTAHNDERLSLPPREVAVLDQIQSALEELPDTEDTFIARMMGQLDTTRFVAKDYDLG
jgi:hypothetical protein